MAKYRPGTVTRRESQTARLCYRCQHWSASDDGCNHPRCEVEVGGIKFYVATQLARSRGGKCGPSGVLWVSNGGGKGGIRWHHK